MSSTPLHLLPGLGNRAELSITNSSVAVREVSLDPWAYWESLPHSSTLHLATTVPPGGWLDIAFTSAAVFVNGWRESPIAWRLEVPGQPERLVSLESGADGHGQPDSHRPPRMVAWAQAVDESAWRAALFSEVPLWLQTEHETKALPVGEQLLLALRHQLPAPVQVNVSSDGVTVRALGDVAWEPL